MKKSTIILGILCFFSVQSFAQATTEKKEINETPKETKEEINEPKVEKEIKAVQLQPQKMVVKPMQPMRKKRIKETESKNN